MQSSMTKTITFIEQFCINPLRDIIQAMTGNHYRVACLWHHCKVRTISRLSYVIIYALPSVHEQSAHGKSFAEN